MVALTFILTKKTRHWSAIPHCSIYFLHNYENNLMVQGYVWLCLLHLSSYPIWVTQFVANNIRGYCITNSLKDRIGYPDINLRRSRGNSRARCCQGSFITHKGKRCCFFYHVWLSKWINLTSPLEISSLLLQRLPCVLPKEELNDFIELPLSASISTKRLVTVASVDSTHSKIMKNSPYTNRFQRTNLMAKSLNTNSLFWRRHQSNKVMKSTTIMPLVNLLFIYLVHKYMS